MAAPAAAAAATAAGSVLCELPEALGCSTRFRSRPTNRTHKDDPRHLVGEGLLELGLELQGTQERARTGVSRGVRRGSERLRAHYCPLRTAGAYAHTTHPLVQHRPTLAHEGKGDVLHPPLCALSVLLWCADVPEFCAHEEGRKGGRQWVSGSPRPCWSRHAAAPAHSPGMHCRQAPTVAPVILKDLRPERVGQ